MRLCEKTREFNKHFTDNLFTLRILVIKSMFVLINLENFEYCVNSTYLLVGSNLQMCKSLLFIETYDKISDN